MSRFAVVRPEPGRLDRAKALGVPSEELEQRKLAAWLDAHKILWCHVPNGGGRSKAEAGRLKACGVKAGCPDILIFDQTRAAIELKRADGGRTSPAQVAWLNALADRGWVCAVAHGADAAIDWLEEMGYGGGKR